MIIVNFYQSCSKLARGHIKRAKNLEIYMGNALSDIGHRLLSIAGIDSALFLADVAK